MSVANAGFSIQRKSIKYYYYEQIVPNTNFPLICKVTICD